jgi:hypothetical protein
LRNVFRFHASPMQANRLISAFVLRLPGQAPSIFSLVPAINLLRTSGNLTLNCRIYSWTKPSKFLTNKLDCMQRIHVGIHL